MHAILLAGGHATRLWPITRHRPKPLLPIGDGTMLDRLLDQLEPVTSEVLVSTNALFADQFEAALKGRPNARLVVEEQASEQDKPGALGALIQLAHELPPEEPLLVAAGDNYYGFDLGQFAKSASQHAGPTVAVKDLAEPELATQFGIVELGERTRVRAFHEKPEEPPSTLAATALYHYPAGWQALFEEYETAAHASANTREMLDAPGRILEWAVNRGDEVHAWAFEEAWFDIGTAAGYLEALEGILGARHVAGHTEDCQLGQRVYIFPDAVARGSGLEDTILLPGAEVEDSTLQGCVVDAQASVRNLSLQGSLVGPNDVLQGPA